MLTVSLKRSVALAAIAGLVCFAVAQDVVTRSYNTRRTGANSQERILNQSNVTPETFGKLFTREVDGRIYAQPLVIDNLALPDGTTRNVVFVCTCHNSVYAFDADDPAAVDPIWTVNLGAPVPSDEVNDPNIVPEIGIVGTPVIKRNANTMYVVAYTKEDDGSYAYRLHALDITTGAEQPNSPVMITGSYPGSGPDAVDGIIAFDPKQHLQRPALLLFNNQIIIAFGSHGDHDPYHGWVMNVHSGTLQLFSAYCTTPTNGRRGAIWNSGQGPATDGSYIYVMTGNGTYSATNGRNMSSAIVKLALERNKLIRKDWFIPYNAGAMNSYDLDLGCSGCISIPGTTFVLGGGKTGVLYLVDSTNMTHFTPEQDLVPQSWMAANGHIHGTPCFWTGKTGTYLYVWGEQDYLRQFRWLGNSFDPVPVALGTTVLPDGVMPGGFLTVSSNGVKPGTGIVWALHADYTDPNPPLPGILRAYNADDVSIELWNSQLNPERDAVGNIAKFNVPIVANGKVYVATNSGYLAVYGLLPTEPPPPTTLN